MTAGAAAAARPGPLGPAEMRAHRLRGTINLAYENLVTVTAPTSRNGCSGPDVRVGKSQQARQQGFQNPADNFPTESHSRANSDIGKVICRVLKFLRPGPGASPPYVTGPAAGGASMDHRGTQAQAGPGIRVPGSTATGPGLRGPGNSELDIIVTYMDMLLLP